MVRLLLTPRGGVYPIKLTNESVTNIDSFQNTLKLLLETCEECETLFESITIEFLEVEE